MLNQFSRTQLLLGADNMDRLSNAKVAVFGIGGVGGYVVEALARSGVGSFVLVDDDKVCLTNINRQIIATRKTVGKYKVDVMKERILEINPDADVEVRKCFYLPENAHEFPFEERQRLRSLCVQKPQKFRLSVVWEPVINWMHRHFRWQISIRRRCVRLQRLCEEN